MITTLGQELIKEQLPEKYQNFEGELTKSKIADLITTMTKEVDSKEIAKIQLGLSDLGNRVAYETGGIASVHLRDVHLNPKLKAKRDTMRKYVYDVSQRKDLTSAEKSKEIVSYVAKLTPEIDDEITATLAEEDNALALQVKSGTRGSKQQLRQIVFGDLLTLDSNSKPFAIPSLNGYAEDVTPLEYWAASHGGRQGYVAVQRATADSGYLAKRVRQIAHRQVVTADDCHRDKPYIVDSGDAQIVGTLLQRETKGKDGTMYPANTIINDDIAKNLSGNIAIRSALTCGQEDGICAHCAGIRESNNLPTMHEAVGMNAVNAFLEGITQNALSSKHSGGEAVQTRRTKKGFEAVSQFIDMPETFVGGATISTQQGIVQGIRPAPQGGSYIRINGEDMYAPGDAEIQVKDGDFIEAGDTLTDGMVDISKVLQYKGVGEGRRSFVTNFKKLLKENGINTLDRNLETLARGYISKVEVTDPDGVGGWIIGDIVDYDALAAKWKPRIGAVADKPRNLEGQYLEEPVLHYSIGTKITPSMTKNLKDAGVEKITAHKQPAPFEPLIIPAKTFVTEDKDFITSLAGENLMRTIQKKVTRGASSYKDSTSYYPNLVYESFAGETKDLISN